MQILHSIAFFKVWTRVVLIDNLEYWPIRNFAGIITCNKLFTKIVNFFTIVSLLNYSAPGQAYLEGVLVRSALGKAIGLSL